MNPIRICISFSIIFYASFVLGQTPACSYATSNNLDGIGESQNIQLPVDESSVYANGRVKPTYRQLLGVNVNKGNETRFAQMENLNDIFSHARIFQYMNKDYWDDDLGEPFCGQTDSNGACIDWQNLRKYTPHEDVARLKLLVRANGKPVISSANQAGDQIIFYNTTTRTLDAMDAPVPFLNPYLNYMNANYTFSRNVFLQFNEGIHTTLTVVPANFPLAEQPNYSFPAQWWSESDWGTSTENAFEAARAYAMMFARTYAPTVSDCATCEKIVNVLEIGNEPWAYSNPNLYHAIVGGFIDGIETYYINDPSNKIKLTPAAFQSHHLESNDTSNGGDPYSWKDHQGTRIPDYYKCYLDGLNMHPYSNDLADNSGYYQQRLIAHPEKTSSNNSVADSKFLFVKNGYEWTEGNMPAGCQNLYVSEYGWDSDQPIGCSTNAAGVGEEAQALYIARAVLMLGRMGVCRSQVFELLDDHLWECGFAYHSSGVWRNDGSTTPKEARKVLLKLMHLIGETKFNFCIEETGEGTYAFILEEDGVPSYLIAWNGVGVNNQDWSTIESNVTSNVPINLQINGIDFEPNLSAEWHFIDANIDTDGSGVITNLYPISNTNSVYDGSSFSLSPIPVLIPINQISGCTNVTTAGQISTSEAACIGFDGSVIESVIPASGGTGAILYQWQISHDGSTWSDINNANGMVYDPGEIVSNTWYRRMARSSSCPNWLATNVSGKIAVACPGINMYCPESKVIYIPPGQSSVDVSWSIPTAYTDCTDYICTQEIVAGFTHAGTHDNSGEEHEYYFSTNNINYNQAQTNCENISNGYLASINDDVENSFLDAMINDNDLSIVWIGLSRDDANAPWEWESGENINYTAPGWNPDNTSPNNVTMGFWGGWLADNEGAYKPYICEVPCLDNGLSISQVSGPSSGSQLSAGTYTISYEATDACNNISSCSFTITIVDLCSLTLDHHDGYASGQYSAGVSVFSDGKLVNNANVDFDAGEYIDLSPGFEVGLGAVFSAEINDCGEY